MAIGPPALLPAVGEKSEDPVFAGRDGSSRLGLVIFWGNNTPKPKRFWLSFVWFTFRPAFILETDLTLDQLDRWVDVQPRKVLVVDIGHVKH